MNWSEVAERVVVEACTAHPEDVVLQLGLGSGAIARALSPNVKHVYVRDPDATRIAAAREGAPSNVTYEVGDLRSPPRPTGLSVVCMHDSLRLLPGPQQRALIVRLGELVPPRGLLVIGDVMWSLPKDMIDEPEQYGERLEHVQTTKVLEGWVREAGFLPDLHRFGPAVGVLIALRAGA